MSRSGAIATGAMAGGGGGAFGGVICSPDDDTFYCKLTRFTSEVNMVIRLLFVFILPFYILYLLYPIIKSKFKKK